MKKIISASIVLFIFSLLPSVASAKPLKACLNTANGKIVIRRVCKKNKGFTRITAETLQGLGATQVEPAGPQGATGATGAIGATGPQGEKGDEGPRYPKIIRSGFTNAGFLFKNLGGNTTEIVGLKTSLPEKITGDGVLQILEPGYVRASGVVEIENVSSSSFVGCFLNLLANNGSSAITGSQRLITIPTGTSVTMSLLGRLDVTQSTIDTRGTLHDVVIECFGNGYRVSGASVEASYFPGEGPTNILIPNL